MEYELIGKRVKKARKEKGITGFAAKGYVDVKWF